MCALRVAGPAPCRSRVLAVPAARTPMVGDAWPPCSAVDEVGAGSEAGQVLAAHEASQVAAHGF